MAAADRCPDGGRPEVASWLLGCMDPDDGLRFGHHLMSCGTCQLAVAELEPTAGLLLASRRGARPGAHPGLPAGSRLPADLQARTLHRVWQAAHGW